VYLLYIIVHIPEDSSFCFCFHFVGLFDVLGITVLLSIVMILLPLVISKSK